MRIISEFNGPYSFLSNFHPSPFREGEEEQVWPTVEHYFQAAKAKDEATRERIRRAATPGIAKKMGRGVELRSDWELVKISCMTVGLCLKFNQNPDLKQLLVETGDAYLEEGNWWGDRFWGVCRGEGQNQLGKLLMMLRKGYQQEGQIR